MLYKACNQLWLTHDLSLVHASVKTLLQEVQSLAVVEIGLIALGISKSNLATTIMQVFSRLLLVWGILNSFPEVAVSPWAAVMILAVGLSNLVGSDRNHSICLLCSAHDGNSKSYSLVGKIHDLLCPVSHWRRL